VIFLFAAIGFRFCPAASGMAVCVLLLAAVELLAA